MMLLKVNLSAGIVSTVMSLLDTDTLLCIMRIKIGGVAIRTLP